MSLPQATPSGSRRGSSKRLGGMRSGLRQGVRIGYPQSLARSIVEDGSERRRFENAVAAERSQNVGGSDEVFESDA